MTCRTRINSGANAKYARPEPSLRMIRDQLDRCKHFCRYMAAATLSRSSNQSSALSRTSCCPQGAIDRPRLRDAPSSGAIARRETGVFRRPVAPPSPKGRRLGRQSQSLAPPSAKKRKTRPRGGWPRLLFAEADGCPGTTRRRRPRPCDRPYDRPCDASSSRRAPASACVRACRTYVSANRRGRRRAAWQRRRFS